MEITIKGNSKEIAALVVGLQGRQKSTPLGSDSRISLLEKKVATLAAVHTCKDGIPREKWEELFTQTDSTGHALSECQE